MITDFDTVFETVNYPSGEFHIKRRQDFLLAEYILNKDYLAVVANIIDFNGLMKCYIGAKTLEAIGAPSTFVIPFFPFARDDKHNHSGEQLELTQALEIARQFNVAAVDLHSDVSAFNIRQFPQNEIVYQYMIETDLFNDDPIVAVPDAGAAKKIDTWINKFHAFYPNPLTPVQCLKKRDPLTGKLSGFSVVEPEKVRGRNVVIVDDICDGGGTFIGLAKELRAAGARNLRLAVTHGLFTKGISDLLREFERIYTVDHSLKFGTNNHLSSERLKTISLNAIIGRGHIV